MMRKLSEYRQILNNKVTELEMQLIDNYLDAEIENQLNAGFQIVLIPLSNVSDDLNIDISQVKQLVEKVLSKTDLPWKINTKDAIVIHIMEDTQLFNSNMKFDKMPWEKIVENFNR